MCVLINCHDLLSAACWRVLWSFNICIMCPVYLRRHVHTGCWQTEAIRRLQLRLLTLHLRPIGLRPSGVIFSSGSCEHFFHQYARTYTCPLRLYMLFLIFFRIWIFHQTLSVVICSSGSCEHFYMNTHTHTCMPIQIFWYDITYFWNLYDADIFECTSSCIYVLYERVTE